MDKTQRIGVFGGSFDPIHNGHILLAEAARKEFKLDKIIFVPAKQPPHKRSRALSPDKDRLQMLIMALEPYPSFEISYFEIKKKSTTYTYQTVRYFKTKYSDSKFYFIMGSDSLCEIRTWKKWLTLTKSCEFITGKRSGVMLNGRLPYIQSAKFVTVKIPKVSSSSIRERVKRGMPIQQLVPKPVKKYILKNGLYKT